MGGRFCLLWVVCLALIDVCWLWLSLVAVCFNCVLWARLFGWLARVFGVFELVFDVAY